MCYVQLVQSNDSTNIRRESLISVKKLLIFLNMNLIEGMKCQNID